MFCYNDMCISNSILHINSGEKKPPGPYITFDKKNTA